MQAFEPALSRTSKSGLTPRPVDVAGDVRSAGNWFIRQPFEQYSEANHNTWRRLYARMREPWDRHANERFLEGLERMRLPADRVPRLAEVNAFLSPRTGFRAEAVSGCMPAFVFFDCLRYRRLPTTIAIRDNDRLDCLPEPDIFHDLAGQVPMHTDRAYAESLVGFGDCAHTAAELAGAVRDPQQRLDRLTSMLKAILRLFWFTIEFGLMRYGDRLKVYGRGLLSSAGQIERAVDSAQVQRSDLHLDWVIHQPYDAAHYQPLLFVVEGFDQIYELTATLKRWMREGRLDHVAAGEPDVSPADLDSFLEAGGALHASHW